MNKVLKALCVFTVAIILFCGAIFLYICFGQFLNTKGLIQAIEREDASKVEELLNNGVDPNVTNIPSSWLWDFLETSPERPLAIACRTGNLEIVELLIENGATAEPITGTGFSPLRETLFYFQPDDPEIVALLLDNGASGEDDLEEPAIFAAAQMMPRVYDKTKENGTVFKGGYDEETAIGITKIVSMLQEYTPIDITMPSGKTLLMVSAQNENLYLTEYLISAGCNIAASDVNGKMAMDYALETKNEALISILRVSIDSKKTGRRGQGDGLREPY